MKCRRVATVQAFATLATSDKRVDQRVVQLVNITATPNQPLVEMPEQLQL
jgi:hypothetical protein